MIDTKAIAGGSSGGMSRSEAARHAALVRWKKESPLAANVAERLAQIRAARLAKQQRKAKGKGKAKAGGKGRAKGGGAKPKATKPTVDKAAQAAAREKVKTEKQAAREKATAQRKQGQAAQQAARQQAQQQKQAAREQAQAARVKQVKQKAKAKEKAKAEPKKKATPEQNRADVAKQMQQEDTGITGAGMSALGTLASGGGMDGQTADTLGQMGLVERDSDGNPRATTHGRALLRAADRGDYGAALDAISRAKDRIAKRDATAAARREKSDARQNAQLQRAAERRAEQDRRKGDRQRQQDERVRADTERLARIQARTRKDIDVDELLHDLAALRDEALDLIDDGAIKAGRRNSGSDQAQIDQGYELAMQLCDLFESLGADTGEEEMDEDGEMGMDEEMGEMGDMEGKAIGKREDVSAADKERAVSEYGDVSYADEKNKKYPIDTPDHIRAAWNYINKADNAAKYGAGEVATIKRKIVAAWKQKIDDAGPPSAETKKDATYILDGDAVKALDGGGVGAYAVRFGSEDEPDMSQMRDYFTKATDFWLDAWDRRPMLFHHAMDEDTEDAPRIGTWTKAEVKDEGVWLEGQLDRHHRYYGAIKELVRRGVLRLSSDSAPHLVRRATKAGGIHEVTRWPLLAASLTPTPAEPRLTAVSFKALIAELGIDDTDNREADEAAERERLDAAKALEDRRRRLLLELDVYTLEATINE